jgi:hypothetical protein
MMFGMEEDAHLDADSESQNRIQIGSIVDKLFKKTFFIQLTAILL